MFPLQERDSSVHDVGPLLCLLEVNELDVSVTDAHRHDEVLVGEAVLEPPLELGPPPGAATAESANAVREVRRDVRVDLLAVARACGCVLLGPHNVLGAWTEEVDRAQVVAVELGHGRPGGDAADGLGARY